MLISRKELIASYLEFFKSKSHKEIPNSSLIPENDPTVLFTTAGMHPLVPFLLGEKHPQGKRLVNVQKCIRTGDIDSVGDSSHLTFFEMLGNWSLGDYFKKEAIEFSFEFLTKILKVKKENLTVSCFKGEPGIPKDTESAEIWKSLGIKNVKFLGREDNWWGPAGKSGPCGPDTEMFVNNTEIWNDVFMQYNKDKRTILVDGMECLYDEKFEINKELLELINQTNAHTILTVNGFREKGFKLIKNYDSSRDTNWNAFSLEEKGIKKDNPEYFKKLLNTFALTPEEIIYFDHDKKNVEIAKKLGILSMHYSDNNSIKKFVENNLYFYKELKQKNVDTGMGVERTLAILNKSESVYETEVFLPIIKEIERISKKKYEDNKREFRIIADHIKASVFILAERVPPSNKEQGYVLRRLIRRAVRYSRDLGIGTLLPIADKVFPIYPDYLHLQDNKHFILQELEKEESRFLNTLEQGMRIFEKLAQGKKKIECKDAFLLYQSYGFPIEMTEELAGQRGLRINKKEFEKECQIHQELSRASSKGKFKSGLADNSESTTQLHTAAHLLNQALREVLKRDISQKGSNITAERLRFDFNFDRKLTELELKQVEDLVNKKITENLKVICQELPLEQAKKQGAHGVFEHKYGDKVKVFSIAEFSKEICAGPHVKNTGELGKFKIIKEESVAAGVRRIKAILID